MPWLLLALILVFYVESGNFPKGEVEEVPVEETTSLALPVLQEVQSLGRLELVKYKFRDVRKYSQESAFSMLPRDEILLVFSGEAAGCLDLKKVREEDIFVTGDTILLTLPAPEICYYKLNQQESEVYDLSYTKIFDKTELVQQAYKLAEQKVEELAVASDILQQTRQNAETTLVPLLERTSGKRVLLSFKQSLQLQE